MRVIQFLFTRLWTVYQAFNPILSFPKGLGQIKHLEGTQAHGFSPREYSPLYKPTHYVPPKRVWFLYLFGLKTVGSWRTRGTPPPRTPRSNPAPQRISVFQSLSVPSKWCKKAVTVYIILGLCVNYWERNLASFFTGYVVLLRTWFLFWLLFLGNSI